MKNILVPTDFSACATFACNTAFELAQFYGATVHLYCNLNIDPDWKDMSKKEQSNFPEDLQRIHNTELLFKEWKTKAQNKNIKLFTHWSGGKLINQITKYVSGFEIDFIVMGSYGAAGKNEYFIGSNTQKTVRLVHCPVMVVKNDLSASKLQKVVFASGFDQSEKKAFEYLLDFVRPFNPEIHLISINTSPWFGTPYTVVKSQMEDFKTLCGDLKCQSHVYRDWSVDAGIRHLAEDIGADLIAISNQNRHPLKRMLSGSNVEALVNHASAPVLSIDFEMETV